MAGTILSRSIIVPYCNALKLRGPPFRLSLEEIFYSCKPSDSCFLTSDDLVDRIKM